jgi:hypothetical protein
MNYLAALAVVISLAAYNQTLADGRPSVVLEGEAARVVLDLRGGSIGDFRLKGAELNPLNWAAPSVEDASVHGFGHFLCLDRWGPPSAAEGARGIPYHGEAAHVEWKVASDVAKQGGGVIEAQLAAALPKAGLSVRRIIRLSANQAVFTVREEVTNENPIGRIYNMVQHPTIAPPFLDENTLVDCNGRKGFAQGGSLPNPEEPAFFWPQAIAQSGKAVDMRGLSDDPNPNVVSYAIDEPYGWVTAAAPRRGLLIGYFWKSTDYPWVSLWRDVHEGKPAARGLEFGTTGLHQPYAILVQKGRIWDRPLFAYLDAGEMNARGYTVFLLNIPQDFAGVGAIQLQRDRLILYERGDASPRTWTIDTTGLNPG